MQHSVPIEKVAAGAGKLRLTLTVTWNYSAIAQMISFYAPLRRRQTGLQRCSPLQVADGTKEADPSFIAGLFFSYGWAFNQWLWNPLPLAHRLCRAGCFIAAQPLSGPFVQKRHKFLFYKLFITFKSNCMQAVRNTSKDRKSEEQENREWADNAGLYAGNDDNAEAARKQATATAAGDDTRPRINMDNDIDAQEAQNVSDSPRMEGEEAERARNKATEGIRQGRDTSGNNERNRGDNDQLGRG
jgi:hypothetical protein